MLGSVSNLRKRRYAPQSRSALNVARKPSARHVCRRLVLLLVDAALLAVDAALLAVDARVLLVRAGRGPPPGADGALIIRMPSRRIRSWSAFVGIFKMPIICSSLSLLTVTRTLARLNTSPI